MDSLCFRLNIIFLLQVVVKPSGMTWHGSRCVTYHDITNFDEIYAAVLELLDILEVENAVMVEAFHRPSKHNDPEIGMCTKTYPKIGMCIKT